MKRNRYRDELVCVFTGTDIPAASNSQWHIFEMIREYLNETRSGRVNLDDLFKEYTYTKLQRFELISQLKKRKFIESHKIDAKNIHVSLIPRCGVRDAKEFRIYEPANKKERMQLLSKGA